MRDVIRDHKAIVAAIAAGKVPTMVWARRSELAGRIATDHANPDYLPGVALPESLQATSDLASAADRASVIVMESRQHGVGC